jgi:hypothetical protein
MIYKRTKQLSGGSRKVTSDVTSKNPSNWFWKEVKILKGHLLCEFHNMPL